MAILQCFDFEKLKKSIDLFNFFVMEAAILPMGCASGTVICAAIGFILLGLRNTAQSMSQSYQSLENGNVYRYRMGNAYCGWPGVSDQIRLVKVTMNTKAGYQLRSLDGEENDSEENGSIQNDSVYSSVTHKASIAMR